ncbi:retrovirus-related pol polyprotein from transposon 17.6 [Tanacetum coccineum]
MDIGRGAVDRFRSGEMGNTWMLSNIVDDASKKIKTMDNRVTYGHRRLVHGGDISTRVVVDTGATHNFISVDEAKRLGLETTKDSGWIKAANEVAKAISGVARGVKAKIEGWEGEWRSSVHGGNGEISSCGHHLGSTNVEKNTRRGRRELRTLNRILWKVQECLGSPWKMLEALKGLGSS